MRKKVLEVNMFINLMQRGGPIVDFYMELIEQGLSFEEIQLEYDKLTVDGLMEQVLLIRKDNEIYFSTIPRKKQTTSLFFKVEDPSDRILSIFPALEENEEIHIFTTLGALESVIPMNTIPLLPEENPNLIVRLNLYEELEGSKPFNPNRYRTIDEIWKFSM